ncbi:MAG: hypothetical protein V4504_01750 [Patescibacteria group bacterium]
MITKRVFLIRAGIQVIINDDPYLPPVQEVREILIRNTKDYSLIIIGVVLRTSIRTYILLRKKGKEISDKIIVKYTKNSSKFTSEKKEVNRLLKGISEYRNKIKHLKEKIIEEETNF